jgi:hypothetical protein
MDAGIPFGKIMIQVIFFEMSRHKSEEVAKGTLNDILEKSGFKKNL